MGRSWDSKREPARWLYAQRNLFAMNKFPLLLTCCFVGDQASPRAASTATSFLLHSGDIDRIGMPDLFQFKQTYSI
jgi:hypothetical protein